MKAEARERSRSGELAFTLIEILVAIAISALVLVILGVFFFSALKMRERATAASSQTLPDDRAISVMRRDLADIVPVGVMAGPMGSDAIAVGMSQAPLLEIFTASGMVTAQDPWGDLQKIDYSLQVPTNRNNFAGRDLVRGVTRNLLPSGTVVPEPQTLLQDVANLTFTYYDGTNWNDIWSTSLSNIPVAIRVSIDFAMGRNDNVMKPSLQFVVPVVAWSSTNSITNQLSN